MSGLAARPHFWGAFTAAIIIALVVLRLTHAIGQTTGFILLLGAFAPMLLWMRAAERTRRLADGCASAANMRKERRLMGASIAYVVAVGLSVSIHQRLDPGPLAMLVLALLPVLPIFAMIYAMGRYLVEERDEYLRHRAVNASLAGLGMLLGVASFWGFLEFFGLVPHMAPWWAVPIWAIGQGLAQLWMKLADRAGAEA